MDIETRILVSLRNKPLSLSELVDAVDLSGEVLGEALHSLKERLLLEKHPVVSGSCKTCACGVKYVYRLTYSGRKFLEDTLAL